MIRYVNTILFLGLCLATGSALATPIDLNILSGSDWRSSDQLETGWNLLGFDDSAWAFARAPYPNPMDPTEVIPGTQAEHMWHDPNNASNGTNGPIQAFFRFEFDLNLSAGSLPLLGQALISVDDDYEFYVNGTLAFRNDDNGFADVVDLVDFTPLLNNGANVLAIHAVDGGWNNPRDRIYERVLFDGTIRTAASVPVPAALPLLTLGLAGLAFQRRAVRR